MKNPRVSICIPCYMHPDWLRRCLESIAIQSFRDFEVVITDDSPTEDLLPVVGEFRSRMPIRYQRNEDRKGSPENWNESIALAKGELIKLLHHDDWFYDSESLAEYVKLMDDNPEASLGFCNSRHFNEYLEYVSDHRPAPEQIVALQKDPQILFYGNFVGAPSATIYRRTDLKFDRNTKWVVDIDFYIQILRTGRAAYCDKGLICISVDNAERVTAECVTNKNVLIPENLYLYNKLNLDENQAFYYFLRLFSINNIRTEADIRSCGYQGPLPAFTAKVLRYVTWARLYYFFLPLKHLVMFFLFTTVNFFLPQGSERRKWVKACLRRPKTEEKR